jgi:hypothetical protein
LQPIPKRRLCVISFDFKLPRGANQARKTRFFRQLYGYRQQVKQQLKSGQVVTRTYHYAGLLDQVPHIKLGKSVLAVRPGTEEPILKLLRTFDEVMFYHFIGWIPISLWPGSQENEVIVASKLIDQFGYLSLLVVLNQLGGITHETSLLDHGFDTSFIHVALGYLIRRGYLIKTPEKIECTRSGENLVYNMTK